MCKYFLPVLSVLFLFNSSDIAAQSSSPYASINFRGSFDHLQSGGFNTAGFFPNTGSDDSSSISLGGAIGVAFDNGLGTIRFECEGLYSDPFDVVTNSYEPPTPTFFYDTEITGRWAVLGNCWIDMPVTDRLDYYVGGGLGGGGATLNVDDGVVAGSGNSSGLVWQAGGGLTRHLNRASIDLGYRFMVWAESEIALQNFSGNPAGNFIADVKSHQVFLAVRFSRLRDLVAE